MIFSSTQISFIIWLTKHLYLFSGSHKKIRIYNGIRNKPVCNELQVCRTLLNTIKLIYVTEVYNKMLAMYYDGNFTGTHKSFWIQYRIRSVVY